MIQQISKYILYNLLGWKKTVTVDHPNKYIICIAPHTSNWDFLVGQLYAKAEGIKANFLMKKEWFSGLLDLYSKLWVVFLYGARRTAA